ncbi:MAG: D-alanyl-D-alanine carboxypeptidase/D-alanyl-D-alanine endopeptidase [Longimicrobiaceae bacterium]
MLSLRGIPAALFLFSTLLAAQEPPLQRQAVRITEQARGDWGLMAWSLDRDAPLIWINADRPLVPASTNKLFTSVWVLSVFGPEHRFATDLLVSRAPLPGGVLRGDVILRGSGDPSFGFPEFSEDPMRPLRVMASQLRARGVRVIEGSVIGDPSAFDDQLLGPDWPRDTGGGASVYAPRVSGLAFQRNSIWIDLVAGAAGSPARLRLQPEVETIPVVSTAVSGGGRPAYAVREPDGDTIFVRGAVSGRGLNRYQVGVSAPALLAAGALGSALRDAGIRVHGPVEVGEAPGDALLVHRHLSVPLGAMVHHMNRHSDNFVAEHLFKLAAREVTGEGSYRRGSAAAGDFFRQLGVTSGELVIADGSGLSERNRASPRALIAALRYAAGQPWSALFRHSLAVAGHPDGTMNRLFRGSPAEGKILAKTGFLRGSRTLAGYLEVAGGERIAFAFIYNGSATTGARAAEIELGLLLVEYAGRGRSD